MADKSASGYQPCKDENFCLPILSLEHKLWKLVFWFSALKIVYIHLPCTLDKEGTKRKDHKTRVPKKSPCQTVTMKTNSVPGQGM